MPAGSRNSPYRFLPALTRDKRGDTVRDVQNLIRDAIVRLELPPGVFIDKPALCARLGVSRFPVSEALGRLAAEGLVEVLPQRGTRVARVDLAECRQAMFIRRALEADAARAAAASKDSALLKRLQQNLREQRQALKADDLSRFHALDLALHEALLDALGFERVRSTVDASRAILDRMRLFLCTPERQAATFAEHEKIVAALARHDADAAARAMEQHLDAVMAELTAFARQHPEAVATETQATAAA